MCSKYPHVKWDWTLTQYLKNSKTLLDSLDKCDLHVPKSGLQGNTSIFSNAIYEINRGKMLLGVGSPTHHKEITSDPKKRKFDLKSLMEVRKVAKKELKYFNSQVSDQNSKKSLGQLKQEMPNKLVNFSKIQNVSKDDSIIM